MMEARGSIDLHAHTTASDGTYAPTRLVDLAERIGLAAVAVTDHDTVEGVAEAVARAATLDVEVVPGIEISAKHSGPGVLHILGYFIDAGDPDLLRQLEWVQNSRRERNPRMIARLNELGIEITLAEVESIAGDGQVGRPHMARVLVERGVVATVQEAFDQYLTAGGPAYVEKEKLDAISAVELIRRGGGVAVLAHPVQLGLGDGDELAEYVEHAAEIGFGGIECSYPAHTEAQTHRYQDLAAMHGLVATGGSDFHGESKPDIALGDVRNGRGVSVDVISQLRERCSRIHTA